MSEAAKSIRDAYVSAKDAATGRALTVINLGRIESADEKLGMLVVSPYVGENVSRNSRYYNLTRLTEELAGIDAGLAYMPPGVKEDVPPESPIRNVIEGILNSPDVLLVG